MFILSFWIKPELVSYVSGKPQVLAKISGKVLKPVCAFAFIGSVVVGCLLPECAQGTQGTRLCDELFMGSGTLVAACGPGATRLARPMWFDFSSLMNHGHGIWRQNMNHLSLDFSFKRETFTCVCNETEPEFNLLTC